MKGKELEEEIQTLKGEVVIWKEKIRHIEANESEREDEISKRVEEKLKEHVEIMKEKEKVVERLEEEKEMEKEEMKRLMDENLSLTAEVHVFREREKISKLEAELRENILAASLERSTELDNMMEGVINVVQDEPDFLILNKYFFQSLIIDLSGQKKGFFLIV